MKRFLLTLFLFLFCSVPKALAQNYDFTINSYDFYMAVRENKTFSIKEVINVDFNTPRHGIYRTLPKSGNLQREYGQQEKYKAKISQVKVNEPFTIEDGWENLDGNSYTYTGKYKIKIGDPHTTVNGEKQYIIDYLYRMSPDKLNEQDELYFNIIGTEWEAPISNVRFWIALPKNFDKNKIYLYAGDLGSQDYSKIKYRVEGQKIIGTYYATLQPGEALTIRVPLPEGYFIKPPLIDFAELQKYLTPEYIPFLIPFLLLIVSALLWYIYGRDDKAIAIVEFESPNGYNPVEIAYIYNQEASNADVATLLIYLANKGYIKIEQTETDANSLYQHSDDFIIKKVKDYDGKDALERVFFSALFKEKDTLSKFELESCTELSTAAEKITAEINKAAGILFTKTSSKKQNLVRSFMFISWILVSIYVGVKTIPLLILFLIIFPTVGYLILVTPLIKFICGQKGLKQLNSLIVTCLFGTFWMGITCTVLGTFIAASNGADYLLPILSTILCIIGMGIFEVLMQKWTAEGQNIYNRVLGFKNYIEKVEIDKLQRLVEQDPMYFYNIIPYAYVFGLNSTWFKKFEGITCPPPNYYSGNSFNSRFLTGTTTGIISAVNTAATPVASSSGSGSSSGGGSSGGGGGGGGGVSW